MSCGGGHLEFRICTKNIILVEDHTKIIHIIFSICCVVSDKRIFNDDGRTTDDGHQVMAIAHMVLWTRWANEIIEMKHKRRLGLIHKLTVFGQNSTPVGLYFWKLKVLKPYCAPIYSVWQYCVDIKCIPEAHLYIAEWDCIAHLVS